MYDEMSTSSEVKLQRHEK